MQVCLLCEQRHQARQAAVQMGTDATECQWSARTCVRGAGAHSTGDGSEQQHESECSAQKLGGVYLASVSFDCVPWHARGSCDKDGSVALMKAAGANMELEFADDAARFAAFSMTQLK